MRWGMGMSENGNGKRPRGLYPAPFQVERPSKASMTLLSKIDVCPYSGALYIREKGSKQTHAMARGELTHAATEHLINEHVLGAGETEIPGEVAKDYGQALIEERVDLALPTDEQEAIRTALWNWGEHSIFDPSVIVGVEIMLSLEIGDWIVRGKLDLCEIVNGVGVVTDWKTSLGMPSVEQYERDFQAQFYALLLFQGTVDGEDEPLGKGLSSIITKQVFPRLDPKKNGGNLFSRYAEFEPQHLADFKRVLEAHLAKLDHGLKTREWAATDGSWCERCPAARDCPIPVSQREVVQIGSPGQALEVAQHVAALKRDVEREQKMIRAYLEENAGSIVTGDKAFSLEPQSRETADKEAIKKLIEENGLPLEQFYKTSTGTRLVHKKVTNNKKEQAHV